MTVTQLPSTGVQPTKNALGLKRNAETRKEFHRIFDDAKKYDWNDKLNCHNRAEDFTDYDEGSEPTQHEARAMCAGCPALDLCKKKALMDRPGWGVWGGISWTYGINGGDGHQYVPDKLAA